MPVCEHVCNRSRSCPSRSREATRKGRGAGAVLPALSGSPTLSALLGLEFKVREHTITQRLKSKSWAGDLRGSPALDTEVSFGFPLPQNTQVMWTRDRDGNSHFHSFHPFSHSVPVDTPVFYRCPYHQIIKIGRKLFTEVS